MGFSDWFTFKSPAQKKRESNMYDRWAFPYGEAQRKKLEQILKALMPKEDPIAGMVVFLIGKEGYLGSFKDDPVELANRTEEKRLRAMDYVLQQQLKGKNKPLIPYYKAMILADAKIDRELNYPTLEELQKTAEELK